MAAPVHDDEILGKAFDATLARKAIAFIRPYKKQLLVAFFFMAFASGLNLISPHLWQVAIDQGIARGDINLLTTIAGIYIVTYLLRWFFFYHQTLAITLLGQSVLHDIREKLFSHIQHLSLKFFVRREVGRIISRLTHDVESLNELLTSGILLLLTDILIIIAIMGILFYKDPGLALVTFTLVPVMWIVVTVFRGKMRMAYRDVRRKVATVTASVAENVSGVKVVKSFSREDENLRRFMEVNRENRMAFMHATKIQSFFAPIISILTASGMCMVYWYGGIQVANDRLTIGVLLAFVLYLERFFQPIREMSNIYHIMQSAMAGAERIFEILDTKPEITDKKDAFDMPDIKGDVEFNSVHFAYDEDVPVMRDVSFSVKAGETIALVGPTGAGKTTIINLLGRQYDIDSGSIKIHGIDIRDVTMRSLRRQIGVVLQDAFLFPGSVKENIRYGRLDATDAEVEHAAETVGAHEFIINLPNGYETDLREGATNLSSGQKQLISFARALLADPRILILDEATSSVDTQTEILIQQALRKLLTGRTSFVIAHRLSTIIESDKIMVIDDGRIVESGKHEELLANDGLYKKLHTMQFSVNDTESE